MMENHKKNDKLKLTIIILAVLLCISSVSLAGMLIYKQFVPSSSASVMVPDNIIASDNTINLNNEDTEINNSATAGQSSEAESKDSSNSTEQNLSSATVNTTTNATTHASTNIASNATSNMPANTSVSTNRIATKLSLHNKSAEDNVPFQSVNMFPGDKETKYFSVQVSYREGVTVRFTADVRSGYEKLAEVLKCRIVLLNTGANLYDGMMKDVPDSLDHYLYSAEDTTSDLYYEFTAYLDTSVGNDYQNKALVADLHWWVDVEDEEYLIEAPKTGDNTNIFLYTGLWGTSLCMLLLLWMKKKKEVQHETE